MKQKNKLRLWTLRLLSLVALYALSPVTAMAEDTLMDFGMNLVESEIDNVVWASSQFLGDETFIGSQGPFWYILQMCMALAGLFTIIMFAGMAFKMMVKHEPVDILKLLRPPRHLHRPLLVVLTVDYRNRPLQRERQRPGDALPPPQCHRQLHQTTL